MPKVKNFLNILWRPAAVVIAAAAMAGQTFQAAARDATPEPQAAETADITRVQLAHEGGTRPLTITPVVGTPNRAFPLTLVAGTEPVADGEIRVNILGSGDPFVKVAQACASVLIEAGNKERDFFLFDLGAGSLANFNGLKLPVAKTTKLFLTHLHADHVGDIPTLI